MPDTVRDRTGRRSPPSGPSGRLLAVLLAVALVAGCGSDGGDRARLDALAAVLTQGSTVADTSGSDPHFDGGLVVLVEATFAGTVEDVWTPMRQRLTAGGYTATCPADGGDSPPAGQDRTVEPRHSCGITGHDTDATVWLGTAPGPTVKVSALIGTA